MHPLLFKIDSFQLFGLNIGPLKFSFYGLLMVIAVIVATYLSEREARRRGIDSRLVLDTAFWGVLGGLLGAKLLFILVNSGNYFDACFHPELPNILNDRLPYSSPDCLAALRFWEAGQVWYGGFIGALLFVFVLLKKRKASFMELTDLMIPFMALGHAIGRIGCFMAGCCWGIPTTSPLGVQFPRGSMAYAQHVANNWIPANASASLPVHATQLYEAFGNLLIFAALLFLSRSGRASKKIIFVYVFMYAILRTVVEFFRGDHSRGLLVEWSYKIDMGEKSLNVLNGFSTSQAISLAIAAAALVFILRAKNKKSF